MKSYENSYILNYILGSNHEKTWYKFERIINKLIKTDLKSIKINKEVTKKINFAKEDWNVDRDEPVVIIKGIYDTYWRVYFINKTWSSVMYLTPNGECFIEELITSYDNINRIWQKDKFPDASSYHIDLQRMKDKINHYQYIENWININTKIVYDEVGNKIRRIQQ